MAGHEASSPASLESSRTIPSAVLSRYCNHLDQPHMFVYELLSELLNMVDGHRQHEYVLLMRVSPIYQRTFLHVAVIANSEVQVQRLLEMMKADKDATSSNMENHVAKQLEYLSTVESLSGFSAYQMACVVGNERIVQMIKTATRITKICGISPTSFGTISQPSVKDIEEIGKVLKSLLEPLKFPDKFLKIMSLGDEFRLHASLTTGDPAMIKCWMEYGKSNDIKELLKDLISKLAEASLLSTFLKLRDSAGRYILHYLADFAQIGYTDNDGDKMRNAIFTTLMGDLESDRLKSHIPESYMNVEDNVGRTPLHLATAQGFKKRVKRFAKNPKTNLNATFNVSSKGGEQSYDIQQISALSLAAENNHFNIIKSLCEAIRGEPEQLILHLQIGTEIQFLGRFKQRCHVTWTPFQLAAFKGHVETLEVLLKEDRLFDYGLTSKRCKDLPVAKDRLNTAPALHLAALGGKPHAIRALLKSSKINPYALDQEGNTALHYALQHSQFDDVSGPWNFVNISQCFQHYTKKRSTSINCGAMIACLELLLQAGVDMDQGNDRGETSVIGPETPDEVQKWWYERLAMELQETMKNVTSATNAVSVTAALVAATSFVGPLQPPLGLSTNTDPENMWVFGYSQVNHVAIDVFLFFDSLSFYLAIASIMLALIPSLPIHNEGNRPGVELSIRYLRRAVVLLFGSITSLICTFSAAIVAIIPNSRWKYKAIIVSSSTLGGFICCVALVLFLKRLRKLMCK